MNAIRPLSPSVEIVEEPSESDFVSGGSDPLYGTRMDSADMGEC